MATTLNSYAKGSSGILLGVLNNFSGAANILGTGGTIRVFPSTVAYPSSPVEAVGSLPAGHILTYSPTYSISGATIIVTAGTAATTTAAGTLSWFAMCATSPTTQVIISDSVGISGQGQILTVSTLTPGNGQSVSISFNLSMI